MVVGLWAVIISAYFLLAPDKIMFMKFPADLAQYIELPKEAEENFFGANNAVNGWFFKNPRSDKVLLYSLGFGRTIGRNRDRCEALAEYSSVFVYDYKGCGKSCGHSNEQSMTDDACAAYDLLVKKYHYKPNQIIGYGESMGTAATAQLSLRRKLAGVIMVASFPSWTAAAHAAAPIVAIYPSSCCPVFDSAKALARFTGPTLVIHSGKDEIIPLALGKELFAVAAGVPKRFVVMPGSQHDYVIDQPEADKKLFDHSIRKFVETVHIN